MCFFLEWTRKSVSGSGGKPPESPSQRRLWLLRVSEELKQETKEELENPKKRRETQEKEEGREGKPTEENQCKENCNEKESQFKENPGCTTAQVVSKPACLGR